MSGFAHTGLGLLFLFTGLVFLPTTWDVIFVILENISNPSRYGEHLQPDGHLRLSLGHIQRKGDKIEVTFSQQSDNIFCCRPH